MNQELAVVKIAVPKNCKKKYLAVDALDSHTRELAKASQITVDGKLLLCTSFKINRDYSLTLTLLPTTYDISEKDN